MEYVTLDEEEEAQVAVDVIHEIETQRRTKTLTEEQFEKEKAVLMSLAKEKKLNLKKISFS